MKISTSTTACVVIIALTALTTLSGEASTRSSMATDTVSRTAGPDAEGDWPMYGHDVSRTNFNPDEHSINAGNVGQLVQRWQAFIGSNGTGPFSAPSVANGRVYVGSSVSSGNDFFAFDAVTGVPAWSANVNYVNSGCFNVGIGSTAAVSGNVVSVGGETRPTTASMPAPALNCGATR